MISPAVVPGPGLLDAFAPTPATFLAPAAAGLNQNLFDDAFGAATPNAFGAPLLATVWMYTRIQTGVQLSLKLLFFLPQFFLIGM